MNIMKKLVFTSVFFLSCMNILLGGGNFYYPTIQVHANTVFNGCPSNYYQEVGRMIMLMNFMQRGEELTHELAKQEHNFAGIEHYLADLISALKILASGHALSYVSKQFAGEEAAILACINDKSQFYKLSTIASFLFYFFDNLVQRLIGDETKCINDLKKMSGFFKNKYQVYQGEKEQLLEVFQWLKKPLQETRNILGILASFLNLYEKKTALESMALMKNRTKNDIEN